ncbi:aldo/keto reductase [bacterium]|nr:aldo/keto reductase [bacterium]
MQYRQLGQRGPKVSTIGFGSWAIGGINWGPTDDEESKQALHAALDAGVTLIDTADNYGYGHSEELIEQVLRERCGQGDAIVATKAGTDFYYAKTSEDVGYGPMRQNMDRDYIIFAVEQSLKRLKVDCLDVLQLHSPDTDKLRRDDPWEALALLKQQGKIRHAGLSVQSFRNTEQSFVLDDHGDLIDVLQIRYNLLERDAEEVLFPKAIAKGVGILVRIPLLFGFLTGKFGPESRFGDDDHRRFNLAPEKLEGYLARIARLKPLFDRYPDQTMGQVALRYAITHPACTLAIPGAKRPDQVRGNVAASDFGPLTADDIALVNEIDPIG